VALIALAMWATSSGLCWIWRWWVLAEQEVVLGHELPGREESTAGQIVIFSMALVVSMLIATAFCVRFCVHSWADLGNLTDPDALVLAIGSCLLFAGLCTLLPRVLKCPPPDVRHGKPPDDIRKLDLYFGVLSRKVVRALAFAGGVMLLFGIYYFVFPRALLHPLFWNVSPSPLTAEREQALKPGDEFSECATCPNMVVVQAGDFIMGSPADKFGVHSNEVPQHKVTIRQRFAVGKFELTLNEWNACAAYGECPLNNSSLNLLSLLQVGMPAGWVSWSDAQRYVAWIVKVTGKPYRLLTEAEWEYAARAGTTTAYSWGDDLGNGNANCRGCGATRVGVQAVRVGSFTANAFRLHDMHGNVNEWVEDCWHNSYEGDPPTDGSAWTAEGDCDFRVVRGGSWSEDPSGLRSAARGAYTKENKPSNTGFRVARMLTP